jgi:hypothetical protein
MFMIVVVVMVVIDRLRPCVQRPPGGCARHARRDEAT